MEQRWGPKPWELRDFLGPENFGCGNGQGFVGPPGSLTDSSPLKNYRDPNPYHPCMVYLPTFTIFYH